MSIPFWARVKHQSKQFIHALNALPKAPCYTPIAAAPGIHPVPKRVRGFARNQQEKEQSVAHDRGGSDEEVKPVAHIQGDNPAKSFVEVRKKHEDSHCPNVKQRA